VPLRCAGKAVPNALPATLPPAGRAGEGVAARAAYMTERRAPPPCQHFVMIAAKRLMQFSFLPAAGCQWVTNGA